MFRPALPCLTLLAILFASVRIVVGAETVTYETREIEGWTVHIREELLRDQLEATAHALEVVRAARADCEDRAGAGGGEAAQGRAVGFAGVPGVRTESRVSSRRRLAARAWAQSGHGEGRRVYERPHHRSRGETDAGLRAARARARLSRSGARLREHRDQGGLRPRDGREALRFGGAVACRRRTPEHRRNARMRGRTNANTLPKLPKRSSGATTSSPSPARIWRSTTRRCFSCSAVWGAEKTASRERCSAGGLRARRAADLPRALPRVPRPEKQKSDYRLDMREVAMRGGESARRRSCRARARRVRSSSSSPAATRTCSCRRRRATSSGSRAEQIGVLRAWIDQGAEWPDERERRRRKTRATGGRSSRSCVRAPSARRRGRNPIDAFILAKLARERPGAVARGRRAHAAPPAVLRPDRPAADAGGDRRVRRRRRPATPTRRSSTGCSPRRATASAGRGTGSTSSTTARRTATTRTSRGPTPGPIATTSSARSTRTSRTRRFVQEQIAGDVLFPGTRDGIEALGLHRRRAVGLHRPRRGAGVEDRRQDRPPPRPRRHGRATRSSTFMQPDGPLRPLPRPQVRPDHAGGLLPPAGRVRRASTAPTGRTTPTRQSRAQRAELRAQQKRARERRRGARRRSRRAKAGARAGGARQADRRARESAGEADSAPEFGYHSAIAADAGRGEMGAGRSRASRSRSTRSCCSPCHDDFNNIGAGFGFPVRFKVEVVATTPTFTDGVTVARRPDRGGRCRIPASTPQIVAGRRHGRRATSA